MSHKRLRGMQLPIAAGCLLTALYIAGPRAAVATVPAGDQIASKGDLFLRHQASASAAHGWAQVIVRLDGPITTERESTLRSLGADVYRHLALIHAVAVRVPSRSLAAVAALPFVQRISADAAVQKDDQFTVASSGANVAYSQYGLTGNGLAVAVVDSGIHFHQDIRTPGLLNTGLLSCTRVIQSVNFVPTENTIDDLCGHGTHVAGIIAGNGNASSGLLCYRTFYGIARNSNVVNVRVLDHQGCSTVSTVISGIQWVVANAAKYKIRVMNLSLGHPVGESYTTDPLCQAVEAAWKSGIVVVCAAGNDGRMNSTATSGAPNEGWGTAYGSIQVPGNDPYVITVGATKSMDGNRAHDRIATYSSRGPTRLDLVLKPDIIAPGNRVISTLADGSYLQSSFASTNQVANSYYALALLGGTSNKYFYLSGTSMASPVVAGAVALILQKYPTLSPDTVKARLMMSSDKWADPSGNSDPCTYGAGYLNIPAALGNTSVATQSAMSPTLSQDASGNVYINLDGSIWGSRAIWGTGVTDLRAIWGTNAIWGTSLNVLQASRAIWGTTVWSDRAIWGTDTDAVDLTTTALNGE